MPRFMHRWQGRAVDAVSVNARGGGEGRTVVAGEMGLLAVSTGAVGFFLLWTVSVLAGGEGRRVAALVWGRRAPAFW